MYLIVGYVYDDFEILGSSKDKEKARRKYEKALETIIIRRNNDGFKFEHFLDNDKECTVVFGSTIMDYLCVLEVPDTTKYIVMSLVYGEPNTIKMLKCCSSKGDADEWFKKCLQNWLKKKYPKGAECSGSQILKAPEAVQREFFEMDPKMNQHFGIQHFRVYDSRSEWGTPDILYGDVMGALLRV